MKFIHYSNVTLFCITLGLYTYEFVYGAMMQIALGLIQLVIGLDLIVKGKKYLHYINYSLKIYWISILIWIVAYPIFANLFNINGVHIAFLFVIPMVISFYFTIVTYLFTKINNHETINS